MSKRKVSLLAVLRRWLAKNWLALVITVGTLLVANWVLLTKPIFYTHDYLHGARVAEMKRGLLEGQFPVIWSQNFGFGFGMPLFEFYAPWPYFVGAQFHILGVDLVWSVKFTYIVLNLVTFAGMYAWARQFLDSSTSCLSASFLTLASYRAMNLFARGAMSELWGIASIAWLLAGITQLIKGQRRGFWVALAGGIMFATSHNITMMIASPLILIYTLGFWLIHTVYTQKSGPWWRRFFATRASLPVWQPLLVAGLLTLGVTCFYWLPAFAEKDYTQIEKYILSDYFNYHWHFLYVRQFFRDQFGYGGSGWGPDDGLSFFLGWAQLAAFALGAVAAACGLYTNTRQQKLSEKSIQNLYIIAIFSLLSIIIALSLFMTLEKTVGLWDALAAFLAFVQFPWRFLGTAIVFLALAGGLAVALIPARYRLVTIVSLWLVLLLTSSHYFRAERYLEPLACGQEVTVNGQTQCENDPYVGQYPFYIDDPAYIRQTISPILVDYLPADFANYTLAGEELDWQRVAPDIHVLSLSEQPAVLVNRMHEKLYEFRLEASHEAEFALAAYPGWQVEIDGQPAEYHLSPRGNIAIDLPTGTTRVGLYLDSTPLRRAANWLSALTLVGIIGYAVYGLCPHRR